MAAIACAVGRSQKKCSQPAVLNISTRHKKSPKHKVGAVLALSQILK